jgi:hypothetical protein
MPRVLHILTQPEDALARESARAHEVNGTVDIDVLDLTVPDPDYARLVERLFAADAVIVW